MALTVKQIEEQITAKRGNFAAVARVLGVTRTAIARRVAKSERLQQVTEEARATMLDKAENVLYSRALEGHTAELIFFLKTQGKARGYTEKQVIEHKIDLTSMSDDELERLANG